MPNVEYVINKIPLGRKQTDLPVHFPELFNLHLDLMENKKKLKSGLPNLKDTPNNTDFDKRRPDPSENPNLFLKELKKSSGGMSTKGKPINDNLNPDEFDGSQSEDDFGGDSEGDDDGDDDDGIDLDDDIDDEFLSDDDDDGGDDLPEDDDDDDADDDDDESSEEDNKKKSKKSTKEAKEPETPKPSGIEQEVDEDERIVNELYGALPEDQKQRKIKEHYLWQFKKIKKANPNMQIPEVDEHDDVEEIKSVYRRTVKDMTLDRSISDNRMYLMVGFFVVEFIGVNYIGIDIVGYADNQLLMFDRYNELLIELGERSYNRWGTGFPVEIRLLFLMILNAFFFYIIKLMGSGKSNVNNVYVNVIKGMMSGNPNINTTGGNNTGNGNGNAAPSPPKPKMKPPTITDDDIEEMED